jgi:hypothetical protein
MAEDDAVRSILLGERRRLQQNTKSTTTFDKPKKP